MQIRGYSDPVFQIMDYNWVKNDTKSISRPQRSIKFNVKKTNFSQMNFATKS